MRFRDRAEAGRILAGEIARWVSPPCVVAGIPRGGVAVAMPIAERLRAPLTVVYARKLASQVAPEFAFGALDEDGQAILDSPGIASLRLSPREIRSRARWPRDPAAHGPARRPPLAHYLRAPRWCSSTTAWLHAPTVDAVGHARCHGATQITVAPCASSEAAERFRAKRIGWRLWWTTLRPWAVLRRLLRRARRAVIEMLALAGGLPGLRRRGAGRG
jgi:hypothetical protein